MTTVTTPTRSGPRLGVAISAVLLGAGLSGCSVAGTDFQPGAAARVGDQTVTTSDVDELTVSACKAFTDRLTQDNQVVPLSLLRSTIAQNLALVAAARQLGEDNGVEPGVSYQRELDSTRAAVGGLPADQIRAVEVLQTSNALVTDVIGQVGVLTAGGDLTPDSDEAQQAGGEALQTWLGSHEVKLDPKYGIELTGDGIATVDTSISFALSEGAAAGIADEPDPTATMALPATQRCGTYSASGVG